MNAPVSPAPRKVPCPTCGKPSPYAPSNPWRPFCSERCRSIDLGAWASESYRVPSPPVPDDDEHKDPSS
jgi:uncharacterized protein